ncbi:hypothetical protein ES703_108385 [subsurface metagenome]
MFTLHMQLLHLGLVILVSEPYRFQDFINETGLFHNRVGTSSFFFCEVLSNALNRLTVFDSVRNS